MQPQKPVPQSTIERTQSAGPVGVRAFGAPFRDARQHAQRTDSVSRQVLRAPALYMRQRQIRALFVSTNRPCRGWVEANWGAVRRQQRGGQPLNSPCGTRTSCATGWRCGDLPCAHSISTQLDGPVPRFGFFIAIVWPGSKHWAARNAKATGTVADESAVSELVEQQIMKRTARGSMQCAEWGGLR